MMYQKSFVKSFPFYNISSSIKIYQPFTLISTENAQMIIDK
jgi:hypothetical protein